jgi:hypothetical protein
MTFARRITEARERREAEKAANLAALCQPSRTLHRPTYSGGVSGEAVEKTEPYRDPALLEMAKGRPCLLCPPGLCMCRPGTVVACHSNLAIHGKAKSRKADDCYTVWGGAVAHAWLDQSGANRKDKELAFMAAHARQVMHWRWIAQDPSEPERFRKAAQRALERLGATQLSEEA